MPYYDKMQNEYPHEWYMESEADVHKEAQFPIWTNLGD